MADFDGIVSDATYAAESVYTPEGVLNELLPPVLTPREAAVEAFAPANIALCKYWGKRNEAIHLPNTSSLSLSLGEHGTRTRISPAPDGFDELIFNGEHVGQDTDLANAIFRFVDYFRRQQLIPLLIETWNTLPTAAGLATSASGFAALTKALNEFFELGLSSEMMSVCARIGSGSAARSLYRGFVLWQRGEEAHGMDSFALPVAVDEDYWKDLCVGILVCDESEKPISSRKAMQRTCETSILYDAWAMQVTRDLSVMQQALVDNDFGVLGAAAEHNAMSMHATMMGAWPPVLYWQTQTLEIMKRVWMLREAGAAVYFTMDAGPNVKLLYMKKDALLIEKHFEGVIQVSPF